MSDTIVFNTEQHFTPTFRCSGYGLGAMVKDMNEPKVLEIGCDIGDTSEFLLKSNQTLLLTGIDPYVNYVDWNGNRLNERDVVHNNFMDRMSQFKGRFGLLREYSDNAAKHVLDNWFDVVFIDGLHEYEQLTKDCENYYPKVKEGGIFAGHDYHAIPGVKKAADEFAAKVGREILFTDCDVWYWVK
jgi:predicted O-methyltransferase YrrM